MNCVSTRDCGGGLWRFFATVMSNDPPVKKGISTPPTTPVGGPGSAREYSEWIDIHDIETAEVMTLSEIKKLSTST